MTCSAEIVLMTANMLDPVLRFSDVAFGIDTTPKALRNWLQRDQVALFSQPPEGAGWRRFCLADVAVLALVRKLVDFGVNVETASSLAVTILADMQGGRWFESSALGFTMFWVNRYVVLVPSETEATPGDATQWNLQIINGWDRRSKPPATSYLTLVPKPILEAAFSRATTGEDGPPEKWFSDQIGPPMPGVECGPSIPFSAPVADPETSVETTPALPQKDL